MRLLWKLGPRAVTGLLALLVTSCTMGPCGVTWLWEGKGSDASPGSVLPVSQYGAAEAVFRHFLPGGGWAESKGDSVYVLSFGTVDDDLPRDFMGRFSGQTPRVITGADGVVLPKPGVMVERGSGRSAVKLKLYTLSIQGERGEGEVFYMTGSEVVTLAVRVEQREGRWGVVQVKEEQRRYF